MFGLEKKHFNYILDVLKKYIRYIDRLAEYQNIGTIEEFRKLKTEKED